MNIVNKPIDKLRKELKYLQQNHCVLALKSGTEIEDMDFDEIEFLKEVSTDIIPLIIKIGGAEARNDIRNCKRIGVNTILAPMIETLYALTNFIETCQEILGTQILHFQKNLSNDGQSARAKLAINLESITAYKNLDSMLESKASNQLSQITIGRGDLSKSMHLDLMDEEVTRMTAKAVRKIKNNKILTSVGGGLTTNNIQDTSMLIMADRINSRHMVFNNNLKFQNNSQQHLFAALNFEINMYKELAFNFPKKRSLHLHRVEVLSQRLQTQKPKLNLVAK